MQILAIWSLVPLPFLNPACTTGTSWFIHCWSLAWRILSITLLACKMSTTVQQFEHALALPFFGIGTKTDLFQSCGHCWVSQICWHIECSTLTTLPFRILNRSAGIPSPPLGYCPVAAAAAKSLQSYPTLCDPIDGSPPGSSIHGIFQARVLESGAIAFPKGIALECV